MHLFANLQSTLLDLFDADVDLLLIDEGYLQLDCLIEGESSLPPIKISYSSWNR